MLNVRYTYRFCVPEDKNYIFLWNNNDSIIYWYKGQFAK